jgi:hypothetical protein
MACYDFDYAIRSLRQAIDFAEIEHDFVPVRKLANEVEHSGHELGATDIRFNSASTQDFLEATLQSVASGILPPEEALRRLRNWMNGNQPLNVQMETDQQYQTL